MPLNRHSMRDHIKHVLMDRIIEGFYKPGERLLELQIAKEMNTSQGPVREAFRDLEGLGLIQSERYKGTRVRALSERELKEAYQVRAVLEELAAELAAPKLKDNTQGLEKELEDILKGAKANDWKSYAAHAMAFHKGIMVAAGNKTLLNVWESVLLESRFLHTVSRMSHRDLLFNANARISILKALNKGHGKTAGKMLREHVEQFYPTPSDEKP